MTDDPLVQLIWLLGIGAALSAAAVGSVRRVAGMNGWHAPVRADRWHATPTALYGGVGICAGFLAAIAVARGISEAFRDDSSTPGSGLLPLVGGAVAAAAVGLVDDMIHLAPRWKLALQGLVACGFLWWVGGVHITGIDGVDTALAFLWILAMMNALNMIDNMDGVAATVSLVGLCALALGVPAGPNAAVLSGTAAVAAGCAGGFLMHNRPKARIFMGDCGSLMLGFLLAALPLLATDAAVRSRGCCTPGVWAMAALALGCCALPLADMTFVSLSRLARGTSPLQGGRDHSTHLLAARLGSHGDRVYLVAGVVAVGFAAAGIGAADPGQGRSAFAAIVIALAAVVAVMWRWLRHGAPAVAAEATAVRPWWPLARLLLDVAVLAGALQGGYLLRWDRTIPPELRDSIAWSLPLVVASCVGANALRGEYWACWRSGGWRSTAHAVLSAALGCCVALAMVAAAWTPDRLYSRWSMVFFALLYLAATGAVRAAALAFARPVRG